ncbi:hypothetical protein JAAARDRAFT_188479 [Jaapia argillacea MUCL 33604]|uniref:Uncharacterized protein n=1 Tax=Jaapia argillacea MUCL 33604 TaxID=933084 RepID=A0A067QR84_9AGAM|nr:hypothetical protein JAAARDRAFT_188479 [Jaapia argillacea MUCL 33604]
MRRESRLDFVLGLSSYHFAEQAGAPRDPPIGFSAENDAAPDKDEHEVSVLFKGDYFGSYGPGELPYSDDDDDDSDYWPEDSDLDSSGDSSDGEGKEDEHGWEPPPCEPSPGAGLREAMQEDEEAARPMNQQQHQTTEEHLRWKTFVVRFPRAAGTLVSSTRVTLMYDAYRSQLVGGEENIWALFASRIDWEIAHWAKLHGAGSTAFSELLAIEEIATLLGLSYKNSQELNAIIDKQLSSGRPQFQREEIVVGSEAFEVFFRDIIECIKALWGDPEFSPYLLAPECHFVDAEKKVQVYFDMNTGMWWWSTQEELEKIKPGATIIPVIISSDKT